MGPRLTLEVLPSPRQQVVEDVEGPLFLGLADGTRFLQEIFKNIKELCILLGRQPPTFPHSKAMELHQQKMAKQNKGKLPRLYPSWRAACPNSSPHTWEPTPPQAINIKEHPLHSTLREPHWMAFDSSILFEG